jgi:hypothetical protein
MDEHALDLSEVPFPRDNEPLLALEACVALGIHLDPVLAVMVDEPAGRARAPDGVQLESLALLRKNEEHVVRPAPGGEPLPNLGLPLPELAAYRVVVLGNHSRRIARSDGLRLPEAVIL